MDPSEEAMDGRRLFTQKESHRVISDFVNRAAQSEQSSATAHYVFDETDAMLPVIIRQQTAYLSENSLRVITYRGRYSVTHGVWRKS